MRTRHANPGLIAHARRARRGRAAFTLMELLVAISLLVLVMYMLATTFTAASVAFNRTRITVDPAQNLRAAMDILHDDFAGSMLVRDNNGGMVRFSGADGGATDQVRFTTITYQSARSTGTNVANRPEVLEIHYFVQNGRLMKEVDWDNDFDNDNFDRPEAVAFNVQAFNIRYFDRSSTPVAWTADGVWNTSPTRLPAAIMIELTVQSKDNSGRLKDHTTSQVIYLRTSETQG